jgi:hypothetical protein
MKRYLSILSAAALGSLIWVCTSARDAGAAIEGTWATGFTNKTGQPVNDFHIYEHDGKKRFLKVTSKELTTTDVDGTQAGGAMSEATLSGNSIAANGRIGLTLRYTTGTGRLDWYWTNDGTKVGDTHTDAQAWYVSLNETNATTHEWSGSLEITNFSNEVAHYNNFAVGMLATSSLDTSTEMLSLNGGNDPGSLPVGTTTGIGVPSSFDIAPGGTFDSFFDVFFDVQVDKSWAVYSQITIAGDTRWQVQGESIVPEPATIIIWSLLGALAVTVGRWRRKRMA